MTDVLTEPIVVVEEDDPPIKKERLPIGAYLAGGWLAILTFAVVFADWLPLKDPAAQDTIPTLAPFQPGYILGADKGGRDMLANLVYGGRNSLIISVTSILIGFLIGGLLGLLSGYFRNWIGKSLASLFDILLAIPAIVLALALVAVLKGDVTNPGKLTPVQILIVTLAIVAVPLVARITRANTIAWSQREFVTAAKAQGATTPRILFREILPNVLPAMMYIALLGMGIAIVAEGGLAIFGASVEPPQTTWGKMIVEGKDVYDKGAPFVLFQPVFALFFTVLSLNYLGDLIRKRFDVRESAL